MDTLNLRKYISFTFQMEKKIKHYRKTLEVESLILFVAITHKRSIASPERALWDTHCILIILGTAQFYSHELLRTRRNYSVAHHDGE